MFLCSPVSCITSMATSSPWLVFPMEVFPSHPYLQYCRHLYSWPSGTQPYMLRAVREAFSTRLWIHRCNMFLFSFLYIYNCAWKIIVSLYITWKGCKDVGCILDRTTATNIWTFYTFFTYILKRSNFLLTLFSEIKLELSSGAVCRSSPIGEACLWRVHSLSWEALCSNLSWQGQGSSLPTSLHEVDWLCSQGQGSDLLQ